ncbi:MAG TPA: ImmA/IrrE family metallo-endopeptidase [Firmicutes bacterium]|nr:ImmA/IrrE family metallo-endopeptidase [Bacillota bacterium]
MTRVAVAADVLRWAVERANIPEEKLQKKRELSKLQEWLSGESLPTLRQLEELAKATWTPLGFLLLQKPPDERLPVTLYRTIKDEPRKTPGPNLLETLHTMQHRQTWMREFLIEQGQKPLPFVKSVQLKEKPEKTARRMRDIFSLDENWASQQPTWTGALRILREAMDAAGIMVIVNGIVGNNTHRKLDPAEFRGFVLVDEYAPLVFINGADSKAAQMFTLAHELAHVIFGVSAAFDLREMQPADDPVEKICDKVAAEFLVPTDELHEFWKTARNDPEPVQSIARHFKVSSIVAARRLLDLEIFNINEFRQFYHAYQNVVRRKPALKKSGGDFTLNQNLRVGRRFASAIVQAIGEGKLLYSEAYNLTGLYGKTFERYTASLDTGGNQ